MRTFIGYILVFSLFPFFLFILFSSAQEINKVQGFHNALEEAVSEEQFDITKTSLITDKDGRIFSEMNRPFRLYAGHEEIPDFVKEILVASEDQHFYEHVGFDAGAIMRALVKNLVFTHIQQGGSTITQQLARNLYLGQEKTYNRKLTELFYAHEIEESLSKDEIMELYLNIIYFSNGVYGIETASQYYFQKPLGELNKAELAFITAIPNNPKKYDPVDHFDQTKVRQERLLDIMQQTGKLTEQETAELKKAPIQLSVRKKTDLYPDYAVYAESELRELVAKQEGFLKKIEEAKNEEEKQKIYDAFDIRIGDLINSGIIIHTSLDRDMQEKSMKAFQTRLIYKGIEGASITIDNQSRQIIAMIGGTNYQKYNFHHAYQAFRQPGSSIKPLLVYGPYIEQTQASISERISADNYCIGNYCPINYGGRQHGNVTMNTAFSQSYNTPALRLFEKVGIANAFAKLDPFDFEKVQEKDYTYAASIGGFTYGMSPLEMTDAYTSFIDGQYQPARAITKVTDYKGKILYEWNEPRETVWSQQTTEKVRTMLSNSMQNGTGKWAKVNKPYAGVKTGTTNFYNDYWVLGLTDRYTTGVWIGHDIPQNMENIERDRPSHLIWRDIMR
ncbi:transglycosylase domain-containing protein [Bacillus sp. SG-1]|uniref:transglycosylase domain-containing protein n=1 Tax=Bacillus sp. SG-1 TaxID=161544 RepID=UPI00015446AD|nr:transglycosylase domain-containing protein [Bacillus sp. SG-1]EDL63466.1 penicillin-binding protein 4 [Bacillus sp. SG-1]